MYKNITAEHIKSHADQVRQFQTKAGQDVPAKNLSDLKLAKSLVIEEYNETIDAWKNSNTIEVFDGLADLYYVLLGQLNFLNSDLKSIKYISNRGSNPTYMSELRDIHLLYETCSDLLIFNCCSTFFNSIPAYTKYSDTLYINSMTADTLTYTIKLYIETINSICHTNSVSLQMLFDEVHDSNMSKFIDGHRDESTGKWIKGPSYRPADIKSVVEYCKCNW